MSAAKKVQEVFITDKFRVYTGDDPVGIELGGSLKNVIAIAAGINDGLGLGSNSKSALMIRGITEISRLGAAMGAVTNTFWGLSGIGDLITTCISQYGRNRWFGEEIGRGKKPKEALAETEMVVEGFATTKAAYQLSGEKKIEMPITEQMYEVLYNNKDPKLAVKDLMTREPKAES
jgi:glycerol-3-phosphate dehydrogenase (NAD(P)+)